MNLKESKFNFKYKRAEDENVIYNTFSKSVVVLTDEESQQLENRSLSDSEMLDSLFENGILIKEEDNEFAFLKYLHYKTKFANKGLFLTLAPTLDCNFACPYCYENRQKGHMGEDVQKGILKFIEDSIKSGVESLNLTWYGGEPLLCFDIVESMSKSIFQICTQNKCRLKMDIVTNGYLLTEEIVEKLDMLGITKVQITIDGLKENHDVRRPLRGGGGTFDKIIENLSLFDDSPLAVLIRMNVDNKNCNDFGLLKKQVDSLENPNIRVYASPVEDLNKDTVNEISDFMSTDEFESFATKACDDGDWDDDDFSVMDDRYCFCTSETENCYVVDNNGDFYKCWDEVGRKEYACFNVLEPDSINYHQIAKFLADDPFSDEKCKNCVFLPLCFGGCKFQKYLSGEASCGFSEQSIKKYIELSYFSD